MALGRSLSEKGQTPFAAPLSSRGYRTRLIPTSRHRAWNLTKSIRRAMGVSTPLTVAGVWPLPTPSGSLVDCENLAWPHCSSTAAPNRGCPRIPCRCATQSKVPSRLGVSASLDGRFQGVRQPERGEDFRGFLICRNDTGAIAGVVNISQIFRGAFQCAYLGFYAMEGHQGQGLMREGLAMTLGVAFRELKLHRLEANIQPSNVRSSDLVKSLGFRLEGFSPCYLKIAGRWRDHDRWAILREQFPKEALGIRGRGH